MDLRFWSWRDRRKTELDEEIEAHLRMASEDRVDRWEDPDSARLEVLREFGNVALVEDVTVLHTFTGAIDGATPYAGLV